MRFCSTMNYESDSLHFMSKTFRPWDIEQRWLLPPSVHELVPAGHVAHFVRDTVREELDLSPILSAYTEARGYPPYHPTMMVALLLYAYSRGVYSSRKIAQACEERVDFMAVTAMNRPDFRTIATFRQRHLKALGELFVQVLKLCRAAGLVKLGHVSLDGTKVRANASVHKAMSYGRMREAEKKLAAEVAAWFAQAEATDAAEDREHGAERRGDEMPDWVANKMARLERIRAAKAALEAEAKAPLPDPDDGWTRPLLGDDRQNDPAAPRARRGAARSRPAQLYRSGQPHPAGQARCDCRLQRSNRSRRSASDHHRPALADEPGRCTQPQAAAHCGTHHTSRESRGSVRRCRFLLGSQSGSSGPPPDQWLRRHRPAPAR